MIPANELLLLDTDVLLHLVRGKEDGQRLDATYSLRSRDARPLISIVSVGELLTFARRKTWGEAKLARLTELLSELVIVPIRDHAIADQYAQITAFCEGNGRTLSDNDRWIAATTAITNAVLLTTDRDFDVLDPTFIRLAGGSASGS